MDDLEKGQPLKLLKEGVKERFLYALGKGASYQISCGYAGITYQTLRNWMIRAESIIDLSQEQIETHPDKIYADFYLDVKLVESNAALNWLQKVEDAANIHWQAAAWKLERRHPEDYGRYDKDAKNANDDDSVNKARSEVTKLKGDEHGQSSQSPS